jgi:hypothetical protein
MYFKISQLYAYYQAQYSNQFEVKWWLQYLTTIITISSLYYDSIVSLYQSSQAYFQEKIQSYFNLTDEQQNKYKQHTTSIQSSIKSYCTWAYEVAYKIVYKLGYKIPYDLGMTYVGVIQSYIDEYKLEHNDELPKWYWFPYFYVASIWYILYCSKTVFNNKMKEIYRDKRLLDCVENHNNEYLKVNYEWHGVQYSLYVKIDKFVMRDLVRATTAIKNQDDTIEYVDCTKAICKLLGPSEDWHRIQLTPKMIGYNNLQLCKLDNETYEVIETNFDANDVLPPIKQIKIKVE